ncbi:MAG: hypothetical protein WD312_02930 [Candidatus Paceibacterota bacterium]
MLILGIILTVLGFIVFQWAANAQSKSVFERPMIFNRATAVIIINLIWIGLFIGGFYSLWQVSPKIVLTIIGIYAVLWILGYFMGSEKTRAKKIFKIYRQLKLFRPKASDEEIFRETANAYFRGLRWDEDKIRMTVDAIFEKRIGSKEDKDIKDVASSILIFENPHGDFMSYDFRKSMKRFSKKQKAIDDAYNAIIGNAPKVTERPDLSENTTKWIKSIGFNPDEMTNEQLAVFSEIDDHGKSNWAVRFFYGASLLFLILAGLSLIGLKLGGVLVYGIISFVIWYIGHKIQMKRVSKKFYEASVMKYAQEQAENGNNL